MKEKGPVYALSLGFAVLVIVAVSHLALGQPPGKQAAPAEDGRQIK